MSRITIALAGAMLMVGALFGASFAPSAAVKTVQTTAEAADAQLAREAAAQRMARTMKRSSPVITAATPASPL